MEIVEDEKKRRGKISTSRDEHADDTVALTESYRFWAVAKFETTLITLLPPTLTVLSFLSHPDRLSTTWMALDRTRKPSIRRRSLRVSPQKWGIQAPAVRDAEPGVNPFNEAMTDAGDDTEGDGVGRAADFTRRHATDAESEHGLGWAPTCVPVNSANIQDKEGIPPDRQRSMILASKQKRSPTVRLQHRPRDGMQIFVTTLTGKTTLEIVFKVMFSAVCFLTSTMTGMTSRYEFGSVFFVRAFYAGFTGDLLDVESGWLKSRYLLTARSDLMVPQTYRAIFTSPSSADSQDTENELPAKRKKTGTKANVATPIGLGKQYTPQMIAYAAVMLHFNLTDANSWVESYNGFDYPALYDFIVDHFLPPANAPARRKADDLLA
ncbi:hypothetical protein BDZ89DRAFT_1140763 [Hymenopellis radicata]|nr:hypothetical protein BDZ89DRAFT_1140763 [Hymenopellis radicata]